jgi:hypothetical protein
LPLAGFARDLTLHGRQFDVRQVFDWKNGVTIVLVLFGRCRPFASVAERRERIRQAALMAMEEYKVQVQNAPDGGKVYPVSAYLHHHLAILEAVEENDLTPDRLRKIATADEKIVTAVLEMDREWRKKVLEKITPAGRS